MANIDDERLRWRDTYFVWFSSARRPRLSEVERVLAALPDHYQLQMPEQDETGRFESIAVRSPGDHAALEITYLDGEDICEQAQSLAEEFKASGDADPQRVGRLARCDARFDVMQFQQMDDPDADEDDPDEMFDPSTLLIVMDALTKLVDGIGVDPQSGLIV